MPQEVSKSIYEAILRERSLKPALFNLKKLRKVYFKPTLRKAVVVPEVKDFYSFKDKFYRGKKALYLEFLLPAGSYATMLIKRLFAV